MKKILSALLVISILIIFAGSAFARDVWVNGYYRSNGTYVQPHYRTSPDNSLLNNFSTEGNTNPYTGEKGYVDPYGNSYITGSAFGNGSAFGSDNIFGNGNAFGSGSAFGSSLFGN